MLPKKGKSSSSTYSPYLGVFVCKEKRTNKLVSEGSALILGMVTIVRGTERRKILT